MIFLQGCSVVLLAFALPVCHCYSSGAPDVAGACDDLLPGHNVNVQSSSAPFQIILSSNTYESSGKVTGMCAT